MFFLINKQDAPGHLCIKELRCEEADSFRTIHSERILDEETADIESLRERWETLQMLFSDEFPGLIEIDIIE